MDRDVVNETTTNESGNYTQRYLIAGKYQVRVEAPGFQAHVQDNVGVSVDSEARVDIKLQVGEVTQTLEVRSEAPMLKTERSDVSTTYNTKQVLRSLKTRRGLTVCWSTGKASPACRICWIGSTTMTPCSAGS